MEIKVSEATPLQLDWMVAKCAGFSGMDATHPLLEHFHPSTDWAQGGPIIEREKIATWTPMAVFKQDDGPWVAGIPAKDEYGDDIEIEQEFYGPTPLIAAMRCHVTNKLGEEVDVPDDLIESKHQERSAADRPRG